MKLGFYYHIPLFINNNELCLPGHFGIFIDSLAQNVNSLLFITHSTEENPINDADYKLQSGNIEVLDLGKITPSWHREFFYKRLLQTRLENLDLDFLIVRSPTPLASYFKNFFPHEKIVYMIVGDNMESARNWKLDNLRKIVTYLYLKYNVRIFEKALQNSVVLVNSPMLYEKHKDKASKIALIKTTTLRPNDFYTRDDTCCNSDQIRLLYTGRFDPLKGLFELVKALKELHSLGIYAKLTLVGWELGGITVIENKLRSLVSEFGLNDYVEFHGKKRVGDELNYFYRNSDIFILPSYDEGFPRTIWEAQANSLPVIATDVGGIPYYLKNEETAIIIKPRNVRMIVDSVLKLIAEPDLRRKLIKNGISLAQENILEVQTKKLVDFIKTGQE